jgi:hypothetical protein
MHDSSLSWLVQDFNKTTLISTTSYILIYSKLKQKVIVNKSSGGIPIIYYFDQRTNRQFDYAKCPWSKDEHSLKAVNIMNINVHLHLNSEFAIACSVVLLFSQNLCMTAHFPGWYRTLIKQHWFRQPHIY